MTPPSEVEVTAPSGELAERVYALARKESVEKLGIRLPVAPPPPRWIKKLT
jgi:hypothetical protein